MTTASAKTTKDWARVLTRAGWSLTLVHAVATAVSLLSGDTVRAAMVVVFASFFVLGVVGCGTAFVIAVGRSRYEQVDMGGAFFLAGSVVEPKAKKTLFALLGAQIVIGVGGASLAPLTGVAFSVLVPVMGIAGIALMGSLGGSFTPKPEPDL